jgi:DNA-binding FrmR family transcriptional regulator
MNKFHRIAEDLVADLRARTGRDSELKGTVDGIDTDLDSMGTLISVLERKQAKREDVQNIFAHLLSHITEEVDVIMEETDNEDGFPAMDRLMTELHDWFSELGFKSEWLLDVLNTAIAAAGDEDQGEDEEPEENPEDDDEPGEEPDEEEPGDEKLEGATKEE